MYIRHAASEIWVATNWSSICDWRIHKIQKATAKWNPKHFSRSALISSPIWPQHHSENGLIFGLALALAFRFFRTRVRSLPGLVSKSLTKWFYWDSNKELIHIILFGIKSILMVVGFHTIVRVIKDIWSKQSRRLFPKMKSKEPLVSHKKERQPLVNQRQSSNTCLFVCFSSLCTSVCKAKNWIEHY